MLLANTTVAEKIVEYFPTSSLLRRHPEPKEKQLKALKELLQSRGISGFECVTVQQEGPILRGRRLFLHSPSVSVHARMYNRMGIMYRHLHVYACLHVRDTWPIGVG